MSGAKIICRDMGFPDGASVIAPVGMASDADYIFIREVVLKKKPESAVMFLCGSDCFDVAINGDHAASYAVRSYAFARAYEVYDVGDLLSEGKNEIIVKYTDGSAPVFRGFICEFVVDGEHLRLPFWFYDRDRSRTFVSHYVNRGGAEIYDAKRAPNLNSIRYGETFTEALPLTLPDGVSLVQRKTVQTMTEIYPESAAIGGTADENREVLTFETDRPTVIFSRFASNGGVRFGAICGVNSIYVDGKSSDGSDIGDGIHTAAVFTRGGKCSFAVAGAEFGQWRGAKLAPEPRGYVYPWNEKRQLYKMPGEALEIIEKTAGASEFPDDYDYLFPVYSLWANILSYKIDGKGKTILPYDEKTRRITLPSDSGRRMFTADFERERAGFVKIAFETDKSAEIEFFTFEIYDDGTPRLMNEKSCGKIISAGGKCEFTSKRLRGFRYVSLILPADTEIRDLSVYAVEMKFDAHDTGAFESSDEKLDAIYKMSVDTAAVCMLDSYVDCPGYEQNVWVGDAAITGMINMVSFGEREYDSQYLNNVALSMSPMLKTYYRGSNPLYVNDTYLPCACVPTYPDGGIPIWSFSWVLHVLDHYAHFGKDGGSEERFDAVEECLSRAEAHFSPRGLFAPCGAWNLIEWANNDLSPYGEVSANNMMLCGCYTRVSDVFRSLGSVEKADEYSKKASSLKAAINKYCYDEKLGAYVDTVRDEEGYGLYLDFCTFRGREAQSYETYLSARRVSVQSATFAIIFDIAEGERRERCEKTLADELLRGNYRAGTPANRTFGEPSEDEAPGGIVRIGTPFFMYYALGAMFKIGRYEEALGAIMREWGEMLGDGLKTCVETFRNSDGKWGRSAAHAWSAAPAVYLKTEILGVKPAAPGYEKFTVEPHLCGLEEARGAVPTPRGSIFVSVKNNGGKLDITVDAPSGCKRI